MSAKTVPNVPETSVQIKAPKFGRANVAIEGVAPYVQLRFSQKALGMMKAKMVAGSVSRKGQKREPRDFASEFPSSMYEMADGTRGFPASSIRNAMISACRIVGFKMTLAKLSVFVEPDGFDKFDGTPLVKIKGTPEHYETYVRNATGVADIRVRAMWRQWSAVVKIRWDEDQFSAQDVANLLSRVGQQVGIGEGRPDSKESAGLGFGLFVLAEKGGK